MPRIRPVDPERAPEGSRPLMEQATEGAGRMLNFYKTFGDLLTAFEGYLNLNATLTGGTLVRQMQESIAVAVSDFFNGCATPIVEWDSIQAHTNLTQRPQFESFGEAIGPYLAGQPEVRHAEAVA